MGIPLKEHFFRVCHRLGVSMLSRPFCPQDDMAARCFKYSMNSFSHQFLSVLVNTCQCPCAMPYLCIIRRERAAKGCEVCRFTLQSYALQAPKLRTLRDKAARILQTKVAHFPSLEHPIV